MLGFYLSEQKEVPMQRRRRGRFESKQGNLFHPQRVRPAWKTLPLETQKELTRLVARMLTDYQARHGADYVEEVRND